jgi:murein DD-endopeptidase MepM/ murein hydrolase activator NlpD
MRKTSTVLLPLAAAALLVAGCADPIPQGQPGQSGQSARPVSRPGSGKPVPAKTPDVFTAVTVQPLGTVHQLMRGTDGRYHLVYELELTNTKPAPATIQRVDVVDAGASGRVVASFAGADLVNRLRTMQPAPASSADIAADASRLLYIELSFDSLRAAPQAIQHRLRLLGAENPGTSTPSQLDYTVARMDVSHEAPLVLGPPLAGSGWVAANGCCNPEIIHRGSVQSVNGALFDSQRLAIDWMRLNNAGEFVHGDPSVATNYVDYGASVLAVAEGTVVDTLNNLPDQTPGSLPDPSSFKTIEEVDGNHVILDVGHGKFVFYAHLKKGSVVVHDGQRVRRGQMLAQLGNTGNTSAPHLHVHLMDGISALGSDGLPYSIDRFGLAGQIDIDAFNTAPTIEGVWLPGPFDNATPQRNRLPLNLNVVNFPDGSALPGSPPTGAGSGRST